MKRFHVHIAVNDLAASIAFYSRLFGAAPAKEKPDYAKWMLDDPRLNFAISSRGHAPGLNHFGMQADSAEELAALKGLADGAAGGALLDQGEAACCYAKSEKHWVLDPQGLAWEHFLTMGDAVAYGKDTATPGADGAGACCVPLHSAVAETEAKQGACCIPSEAAAGQKACCP
jgi:catechol 2,3-dioxygenase-like lactoylglutathione lyase family enzyme